MSVVITALRNKHIREHAQRHLLAMGPKARPILEEMIASQPEKQSKAMTRALAAMKKNA